jgi:hypothetical protein
VFAECLTRKLLIYGLGRGLDPADDTAVKKIVQGVAADKYRFSSLVLGIVKSELFQHRRRDVRPPTLTAQQGVARPANHAK